MNIIIEGPDGAGKTTLANQLALLLNLQIKHFGPPQPNSSQFYMYRGLVLDMHDTILDRAWYSDMVYGPIFRGKAEISIDFMNVLEYGCDDTIVIYCTGPVELMWQAAQERGESYVTSYNQFVEICERYDDLMLRKSHSIPIHRREATWLRREK